MCWYEEAIRTWETYKQYDVDCDKLQRIHTMENLAEMLDVVGWSTMQTREGFMALHPDYKCPSDNIKGYKDLVDVRDLGEASDVEDSNGGSLSASNLRDDCIDGHCVANGDGGVANSDGVVANSDGGVANSDGGVANSDGGVANSDGGVVNGKEVAHGGVSNGNSGVANIDSGVANGDGKVVDGDSGELESGVKKHKQESKERIILKTDILRSEVNNGCEISF